MESLENKDISLSNVNENVEMNDNLTISKKEYDKKVKKLKSSRTLNFILSFFLVLFVIIFIFMGLVVAYIGVTFRPYIQMIFSNRNNVATSSELVSEKAIDIAKFNEKLTFIDNMINMFYYYDKDNKKIEDAMFAGYMNALGDKYAEYLPAEDFEEFTEQNTEGVYYGIGCLVSQDKVTNDCTITKVYSNSPAEKGGLKEGDIFVSIDGEVIRGKSVDELVAKIKGPEGTERKIGIYRPSDDKNYDVVCYCGKVDIELVESKIIDENIGYISVSQFTGKASSQFKTTITDLVGQNVKGLMIDLRGNPGGELTTVLEMIDCIVKDRDGKWTLNQKEQIFESGKTLLVYIKEKDKIVDATYADDRSEVDLPIVILTDGSTASAAELFTETLRDYDKAEVVGVRTYGKGVVQNMIPYDDGSAIKFTVSEYFPPSGYSINGRGILPDYSLDYDGFEVKYDSDNNIVIYEDGVKYTIATSGAILKEEKIATGSEIATSSEIDETSAKENDNSNIKKIKKYYQGSSDDSENNTDNEIHSDNLKIYDENNKFLEEDWFVELDDEYADKQLLQAIIVMRDKIKKAEEQ